MSIWEDEEEEQQQDLGEKGEYCEVCRTRGYWMNLTKCPMCHRYVCDDCRYTSQGKIFCSRHCANEFFWGGEDGETEE